MAPFISEFKQLAKRRLTLIWTSIHHHRTLAALFLAWFLIPLPLVKSFPAITEAIIHQDLYIQEAARVEEILVKRGDRVEPGQLLLKLSQNRWSYLLKKRKRKQSYSGSSSKSWNSTRRATPYLPQKEAELAKALSEVETIKKRVAHLTVRAEIPGTLYEFSDLLKPGLYLSKGTLIGKIAAPEKMRVIAFVPEVGISWH